VVAGAFALGDIVVAQRQHRPAGPDAFLNYQVSSTSELVAELQAKPGLRRRYARHFGVSESRVIEFVKNALVPYRLPASRTVLAYGVNRSGAIYAVRTRLPKGTRVWATRSGEPVLKWLCANPLTRVLPGTRLASGPRPSRLPVAGRAPTLAPLAPFTAEIVPPEIPPVLAPPPVSFTLIPPPVVPEVLPPPVTPTAAGRPNAAFLLPLGLALGFALPGSSTGSAGGNVNPPPIPELSTMVSLGAFLCLAGLGLVQNRRPRLPGHTADAATGTTGTTGADAATAAAA
jgi:hypothetical protein